MCLEGVQLFRMVVLVFNTTLRPIYMFAAGYGVPAVIVAISAAVNANGYGTDKQWVLDITDISADADQNFRFVSDNIKMFFLYL